MNNVFMEWEKLFCKIEVNHEINNLLDLAYNDKNVCPKKEDVFKIFNLVSPKDVRVVIIGQDPYHTKDMANGIAFSTKGLKTPPSLKNIFKELENDTGLVRTNNDLSDWVKQGVLLINSVWTVIEGKPNSHQFLGWENITGKILKELYNTNKKIIFCLWGNSAKYLYNNWVNKSEHVFALSHPSPFSCRLSFNGSKVFSKINNVIKKEKQGQEIIW